MECGRVVRPMFTNVQQGRGGCKFCALRGFNFASPSSVYLIEHPEFCVLQVGVTSKAARKDRLRQHMGQGWRVLQTWDTLTGEAAAKVEAEVLKWWRHELLAPVALTPKEMPQGGWTETVALIFVDVEGIKLLITRLVGNVSAS